MKARIVLKLPKQFFLGGGGSFLDSRAAVLNSLLFGSHIYGKPPLLPKGSELKGSTAERCLLSTLDGGGIEGGGGDFLSRKNHVGFRTLANLRAKRRLGEWGGG